jgi:4-amino-4-deoxy-L-arabinose transferase-like glycosyltransferase
MLERVERAALMLLRVLSVLSLVFAALGTVLLTLGYDEVWLLEAALEVTHPAPPAIATEPVLTSGGPYALAQVLILWLTGATVLPARLFSLLCFFGAAFVVHRAARRSDGVEAGWIATATLLATPGALFYAATAFAEVPAFLFVLLASMVAARKGGGRLSWWLGVGVVAGLAAATRVNVVVLVPCLVIFAWPRRKGARPLRDVLMAAALAVLVFAACLWIQGLTGTAFAAEDAQRSAGLSELLPRYPELLTRWHVANALAPLPLLVAATAGAVWAVRRDHAATGTAGTFPWLVLLPFAWLAYGAWMVKAPIPHLRYLWPALPCFAVLGGHALGAAYQKAKEAGAVGTRLAVLALALSLVVTGVGTSLRQLVYGDHDQMSLEWSGQGTVNPFRRFRALSFQRAAARHLAEKAKPGEMTLALGMGRAIGYLAERPVMSTGEFFFRPGSWPPPRTPRVLVSLLGLQFLHAPAYLWLEENAEVEAKFGPYVFYRVKGPYPKDLEILIPDDQPYPEPILVRP